MSKKDYVLFRWPSSLENKHHFERIFIKANAEGSQAIMQAFKQSLETCGSDGYACAELNFVLYNMYRTQDENR